MPSVVSPCLLILLCTGVIYFDLRRGKVPNWLNLSGFSLGVLAATLVDGKPGPASSLAGALLGLSILIVPFILHMVGGGDVKFLAAAGAVVGWQTLWLSFLVGAGIGGLVGIALLVFRNRSLTSLKHRLVLIQAGMWRSEPLDTNRLRSQRGGGNPKMPYSVPMSAGLLIVTFLRSHP